MAGLLSRVSTVTSGRMRASTPGPTSPFWYQTPEGWTLPLEAAGINVTPELALTLSYVYCAVDTISSDLGAAPFQLFEDLGENGRRRVSYRDPGIGGLAYRLQWQPNAWQTAKAFWSTLVWQWLLRSACYAELTYREGSGSFIDQLVPRHPDRVKQEILPDGVLRYKLTEADGSPRYVSQDEMFVVRNTSSDGLNAISRSRYGAKAFATGLSLQDFTRNYFRKGTAAALLATYKGETMDEDEEGTLHTSISRYLSGVENAGGVLVVHEDIDVKSLGVDAEKAQLLGLKNITGRDVARMFKMPPSWLGIEGAAAYGSQLQDAQNYVNRCQIPLCVEFEQAAKRDLIIQKERFFGKFNLDYLLRGSLKERMEAYEIGIRSRVIRPSEARVREDMNPDEKLDRLSEGDNRPGAPAARSTQPGAVNPKEGATGGQGVTARAALRGFLAVHDNASRVLRRERAAIEKLAKRYAADPDGFSSGLREFYSDHAAFVAETMRVAPVVARAYAAQHGAEFEEHGAAVLLGPEGPGWERHEADELAALSLAEGPSVDAWFSDRRLSPVAPAQAIQVHAPVTVDARTNVAGARIENVEVKAPPTVVQLGVMAGRTVKTVTRGADGRIAEIDEQADGSVPPVMDVRMGGRLKKTLARNTDGEIVTEIIEAEE